MVLGIGGPLFWASADVDSGIYIDTLCKGADDRRCVSLTFDDGPDEVMTPKVLDVLKENGIKATFFIIGSKAEKHPELISRIVEEGHIVGGHSWAHKSNFPIQSSNEICHELLKSENMICGITGKSMRLFRPPFGVTNPLISDAVEANGYITVGWSIRSLDTDSDKDRNIILERIVKRLHNGAVILLHDRCACSDELLRMLITALREKNYDIIGLDEMFNIEPYSMNV
jgi:peptidoglycan/xylan/chitin deacetylase (PgdA/CDA1 family)